MAPNSHSVMHMRRHWSALVIVLGLVVAACGGSTAGTDSGAISGIDPVTTTAAPTTSTAPGSSTTASTAGEGSTTSTTTAPGEPADEAVIAPDFTLALGTGGTYVLSEDTRPVYLVFWAEW